MAALRSVLRFALATTALRTSEAPTQMIAQYGLLGGDLNILANPWPNDPVRDRHLMVVSRIKAYGLVDCS